MADDIATIPDTGRTLIYDGLAQNDIDMAGHQLLNLDTHNLPPFGMPPPVHPALNQWLHDFDMTDPQVWHTRRPTFEDIGPDNGTLTGAQQLRITSVGDILRGQWLATPLGRDRVPSLELIRPPMGDVSLNFKRITSLSAPIDPDDAVSKRFMDSLLLGLNPKEAVRVASPGSGRPWEGPGGLGTIDGIDIDDGDRVLLYQQGSGREYQEGIWIAHDGPWDRAPDTLGDGGLDRAYVTVLDGDLNKGSAFVQVTELDHNPPTLGDDPNWLLFSMTHLDAPNIIPGGGMTLTGNRLDCWGTMNRIYVAEDAIDIDSHFEGQPSIVILGPVNTGTWEADVVAGAFGGTGVANAGRTITLAGNFSTIIPAEVPEVGLGLTFSLTANTTLKLPSTGIVASLAGTETFSSKRIVKRVLKIATNAKPSINVDNMDAFCITALSESIASMSDNLTGTPTDRQELEIWIKQATGSIGPASGGWNIAWGTKYIDSTDLPLPILTTPNEQMFLKFVYASELLKWVLTQKLDKIS
jgi:hypothetical protein